MPSKDELNLLYQAKAIVDASALANGGSGLTLDSYWSSSEVDATNAWVHNFSSGAQHGYFKYSDTPRCRAIRTF